MLKFEWIKILFCSARAVEANSFCATKLWPMTRSSYSSGGGLGGLAQKIDTDLLFQTL